MTCPHCGAENGEGATTCATCGRDMHDPSPSPMESLPNVSSSAADPGGDGVADEVGSAPWTVAWKAGIRYGSMLFLLAAVVGQIIAWFDFLLIPGAGNELDVPAVAKIGALYLASFSRIPLSVEVSALGMTNTVEVALAFGLVTLGMLFLLYRAGKKLAADAGGDPLQRMVNGLMVAPAYAVLTFLVALVMKLRPLELGTGQGRIAPSLVGSLVLPLVLAAVAGGAGGLLSDREALSHRGPAWRRTAGALAGGWRMLVFGMVFAVAGLLVLTVIRPDDSKIYFAGYRAISDDGGAVAVVHNTLLLPNEAVMVIAPAMGACDGLYGGVIEYELVCYTKFPSDSPPQAPPTADPITALARAMPTPQAAPAVYFIFLLVPLLATILGGRAAARRSEARDRRQGALSGALAGVVFAALVGSAAWFAGISVGGGGLLGGGASTMAGGSAFIGAGIAGTAAFGFAWGIVGGALGGALGAPRSAAGSMGGPEEGDDEPDEADLGGGGPSPEEDPSFPGVPPDPA